MPERKGGESGFHNLEFSYRQLSVVVEGGDLLETILSGKRDMSRLNLAVGILPTEVKVVLEEVLWRVVEITSRGFLPRIIEVDKFGNSVEQSEN